MKTVPFVFNSLIAMPGLWKFPFFIAKFSMRQSGETCILGYMFRVILFAARESKNSSGTVRKYMFFLNSVLRRAEIGLDRSQNPPGMNTMKETGLYVNDPGRISFAFNWAGN
jgi:hypothetical protein